MNFYSTVVSIHVVTAILGLGPLTVLAVVSSRPVAEGLPWDRVAQFLRLIGWSLAGMFVTGAVIVALTHGALGQTGWLRASVALFLLLGLLHGLTRRHIRRICGTPPPLTSIKTLSALLWTMCAVIAAITYLMEAKPW